MQGGFGPPFFVLAWYGWLGKPVDATNMNAIHEHLWEYIKAKRADDTLAAWLNYANTLLRLNGLEPQEDALDAQRLLKTITRHYTFFL